MTSGADDEVSHGLGTGKILLVGDVKSAFLDASGAPDQRYEVCADVPGAIDAAAENGFAAIAVAISAIPVRLNAVLKDLRDHCDTKIILLAQMYEEPIAIRLVNSAYNGASLANDYLICPIRPDTLYESITAAGDVSFWRRPELHLDRQAQPPGSALIESRIRNLERLATEDDLTGLKNRRYIREFARQIIERARKENGQVTLLLFDIDDFKHYNDLYGHSTGDRLLRQAAVLVRRCCRSHDVVGRIGGDEFAVVFWDEPQLDRQSTIDSLSRAESRDRQSKTPARAGGDRRLASADHPTEVISIATRFIQELEKAELPLDGLGPEGKGVLTISGGLAAFPRDGQTSQDLFLQADKALLEAKRSGKNRIYLVGKPARQGEGPCRSMESDITDIE